jgi:hypothetical protein
VIVGSQQGGVPHRIQGRLKLFWCRNLSNCYSALRIAQVQVVFQLPSKIIPQVFLSSDVTPPQHLAYVKWFSAIPNTPDNNSRLYKVSRLTQNGQRVASMIPIDYIYSGIHLFPCFGQDTLSWNTFSVLELCQHFYINPFTNCDTFLVFL